MIEIFKQLIDLIMIFFNGIFNFKIELVEGTYISVGILVVAFVFVVVSLYIILKAVGVIDKGGDD